jgi:hypothetical protein
MPALHSINAMTSRDYLDSGSRSRLVQVGGFKDRNLKDEGVSRT